jgi:glycosyltransferase involved in cell wall biosynthesis
MSEYPLVCICVPTHNSATTVRETLESILLQSYKNIIVHVSDNASTDDTLKIIESINDPRMHIHRNSQNIGGEGNFNRCINLAEGKYTAIFHADDIYERTMVEAQVKFLELHHEAGAVFTAAITINDEGKKIGEINFPTLLGRVKRVCGFGELFKSILKNSNYLICPSVLARTEVYKNDIKNWRGDLFRSSADLDVWLRIASKHAIGMIPEHLMRYRISGSQWSAKIRLATEPADFFLVIDYYFAQESVRNILDVHDLRNYTVLIRRDRVMRAINYFIYKKYSEAKDLLDNQFPLDAWVAGMQSKRGLAVLMAGLYMHILLLLNLGWLGRVTLGYLKRTMNK